MIVQPIYSDELLDVAYKLAGDEASHGSPNTTALRRSISTSYYALFHELVYASARLLCGEGPDAESERNAVARWMSHTDMVALARAVREEKPPIATVLATPSDSLRQVVTTFADLQQQRERADYDYGFAVSRPVALQAAAAAEEAIEKAKQMWERQDGSYLRFLRLMVGAVRIAKNR